MASRHPQIACLLLAVAALSLHAQSQRGPGNILFQRYPFDKWAAEEARPQIKWSSRIDGARLSTHQRLVTLIHVNVDGAELQKRQGRGQLLMFTRIEDTSGHRWQTGNQVSLARFREGTKFRQLEYTLTVFIEPGDYTVSLAVSDARTLEHSFIRRPLHIGEISGDPLPESHGDIPPVEFLPTMGIPDGWYQPTLRSRMAIPVSTHRPVRVELLVNTTPSALGSINMFRQNMEVVVPAMKVLTGIRPAGGSAGLSIIDMNRRTLTYEQPDVQAVDWRTMRRAFTESGTATVDAKTLAGQRKMLDYFAGEATRRLGPDDVPHVLIVLSAPVFFTHQDKAPLPDVSPDPNRRVFYIRYASPASYEPFADDIEHVLKPLRPRTFRVMRPEDFRKALGIILDEIAKL